MIWINQIKVIKKSLETKIMNPRKWLLLQTWRKNKNKNLPWWVELLFVQIGLPDKLLIKILKPKKAKELIKMIGKSILTVFFVITALAYFYPVIKDAKNKLDCEEIAKNYFIKNKNIIGINNKEIKMLSTNFCNGGDEIYKIENLKIKFLFIIY